VSRPWAPPSPGRVGKNLVKKKTSPVGFFGCFWAFWGFLGFLDFFLICSQKICFKEKSLYYFHKKLKKKTFLVDF